MSELISASTAYHLLHTSQMSWLDVRSENEFATAAIPGFQNAPILTNQERHEVGTCYRQRGQEAAIQLGHRLVDPTRYHRVAEWLSLCEKDQPIGLNCWRGGLRSQIASEWVRAEGRQVLRIQGGYKAMRQIILETLAQKRTFLVLTGFTGVGKSRLLQALSPREVLPLETFAQHRGSSFGALPQTPQPTQTNFENRMGSRLLQTLPSPVVEDESRVIGSLHLPEAIFCALRTSPIVRLNSPFEARCEYIYEEYVAEPLREGMDPVQLQEQLIFNTQRLKTRLGGLLFQEVTTTLQRAFQTVDKTAHWAWIGLLLKHYYDLRYQHSEERSDRPLLFEGNHEECLAWIQNQFASQRP